MHEHAELIVVLV